MRQLIEQMINDSIAVKQLVLQQQLDTIQRIARMAIDCLQGQGKILLCGNGGSAADAQHIAAELVGKFLKLRDALPAVALTTNTSILTAIANDISYDAVFARQVQALCGERDLLLGISTSGNSPNVLEAVRAARERGAKTVGLTGGSGGRLKELADLALNVPAYKTPHIQETHIWALHFLCEVVEQELFGEETETALV